jgi:hypothetical protein
LNDDMTDVTEGTVIDTRQHASAARRHRPTHHRPGGGFENPWPGSEQAGFLRLL